jgi:hypothetical protein
VALVYKRAGVSVTMSPAVCADPQTHFSVFVRESHASSRVRSIRPYVALIISPHTDPCRSNPAWVEFDDHGVDTNVVSASRDTAALVAIARSIASHPELGVGSNSAG